MSGPQLPRVLCVDDEANLLKAIERSLRKFYDIHTATDGFSGLKALAAEGPFEVVVSDMRMPGMDGAEFLRQVREQAPDSVRLLLTGFAELETVVTAVNEGYIYRFLAKPCTGRVLYDAIQDGVTQHRLITAEKVLLEQTLRGCVKALSEVLAMASPAAFGRGTRICQMAMLLAGQLHYRDMWQIEVSAMLSQLAAITLPAATATKLYLGQPLDDDEEEMVLRMPGITRQILGDIPRLEAILEILRCSVLDHAPADPEPGLPVGDEIPLGARILHAADLLEGLQLRGESPRRSLEILRSRSGQVDPAVLDAYETICDDGALDFRQRAINLPELRTGMVLTEDLMSTKGLLLVSGGQEITVSLMEKMRNYARSSQVKEPIWVRVSTTELLDDAHPRTIASPTLQSV